MFVKRIGVYRLGEDTTEIRSENPTSIDQVNLSRSGNCNKSEDKQVKSYLQSEQKSEHSTYSPALKNFKNCILNDKALAECNLFSSSTHTASSEGEVSRYEYVNLLPSCGSSNALQLVRCSFPSQCLPNNFIGSIAPMAYFENGPSHPILLTSCYPEAQPGFSYSNGNVIIPHGACQGIQYIVPYPVNGFNSGLQPILPVILPNNHTLPVMECFNNLAFYSPIQCLTNEHGVSPNNVQSFDSIATKQPHFLLSPSDECPTTVSNDVCPNLEESNMQEVWHQTFDDLFKTFPDQWILIPTPQSDPDKACRVILRDNAKVRFMCRECRNAWTSMKGCIVFWLNLDQVRKSGEVYFRLFGQQCQKCETKEFQFSMWYPEEVKKVLKNLHVRVGNLFYGLPKVEFNTCRRQGKPRSPHNSSLCQACFNKVCTENIQ